MNAASVSVLIVSYQVRDLLRRCLATVRAQRGVAHGVWVLDNASSDGSADMVAAEFPEVHLIRNHENVGFARANNALMALAGGDLLALVNPDTELPPDALATVVGVFSRHSRAGVVALALDNTDGSPQPSCLAFPDPLNLLVESLGLHRLLVRVGFGVPSLAPDPRGGEGPVPWVSGAFFVIHRAAYQKVGGLDETLFMYGEEMEWCWRARRAGFEVVWSDRCRVLHHRGGSGGGALGPLFVMSIEGRLAFVRRHGGAFAAALGREFMTFGAALRLGYWRLRAWRQGAQRSAIVRAQLERFGAVLAWRRGLSR
jgi:GT2 family glycosyltransferase